MITQRTSSSVLENQGPNGQSFKQKMREAWDQKPPLMETASNPETLNYFGMALYVLGVSLVFCSTMFYLIPSICTGDDVTHICLFLRLLVLVNTGLANINWLLCAERKSQFVKESTISAEERQKLVSSSYLPLGYSFCTKCQLYSPPRAYHCKLCHACVLRRDYHCYITGSCVGFTSQRRYLPFLFHISIGGLINTCLCAWYLSSHLPFTEEYVTYVPFVAIYRCAIGEISFANVFFIGQLYAGISVMVISWCYLMWEWLMVVRGQTSFEATRSIQTYRIGMFHHLYTTFGSAWFLNFIFPMPTTIPSDGVHWPRRSQQKAN